jgi:hypothetical protein
MVDGAYASIQASCGENASAGRNDIVASPSVQRACRSQVTPALPRRTWSSRDQAECRASETSPPVANCLHIEPQSTVSKQMHTTRTRSSHLGHEDSGGHTWDRKRGYLVHYEMPPLVLSLRLLTR